MSDYHKYKKREKPEERKSVSVTTPQYDSIDAYDDHWPRPKDRKLLIGTFVGGLLLLLTGAYFALGIGSRYSTIDSQITQQHESVSMGATEQEGRSAIRRAIHDVANELNIPDDMSSIEVMDKGLFNKDWPDLEWLVFKDNPYHSWINDRAVVLALNYRTKGEPAVLTKDSDFLYEEVINLDQSDITTPDYVERFFHDRILNIVSRYYR